MAGCMQWFQVTCPTCTAQLQVRLPEGITSVQCSQCKAVFAVQIQPTALDSTQPPGSKRSRKRKAGGDKDPNAVPRALSAYNVFMKQEVAKVKAQHVEMAHRDAFKMVRPHAPSVCRLGRRRSPPLSPPAGACSGWLWPVLRTLEERSCRSAAPCGLGSAAWLP
jgi:LSD1 subclass zinc finger protein